MEYINFAIELFLWLIPAFGVARILYIIASVAIKGSDDKSYVNRIRNTVIFVVVSGSAVLIRQIIVGYLS